MYSHRFRRLTAITLFAMLGTAHAAETRIVINASTARHFTANSLVANATQIGARFGHRFAVGDFNQDGFDDLAVGIPYQNATFADEEVDRCGAVMVVYGAWDGLGTRSDPDRASLHYAQIEPLPQHLAAFGAVLAAADFDGDGYDDLAVGAPAQDINGSDEGAVYELHGSSSGLATTGRRWDQNQGLLGLAQNSEQFGSALVAADFNDDGYADLAIGIPTDRSGTVFKGSVAILFGSNQGLDSASNELWNQDSPGVPGLGESGDLFGRSLAAGDLNQDGFADLAIGAPGETIGSQTQAGSVNLLFGTAAGMSVAGHNSGQLLLTQNDPFGLDGGAESDDRFGEALQILQWRGHQNRILLTAAPGEVDTAVGQGMLQRWTGYDPCCSGASVGALVDFGSPGGRLGSALSGGWLAAPKPTAWDDIAAGEPYRDAGRGAVRLIAFDQGTWAQGAPSLYSNAFGVARQEEAFFGAAIAVGDFNGRGPDELVIGSPMWDDCVGVVPPPSPPLCFTDVGQIVVADDSLFADSFD